MEKDRTTQQHRTHKNGAHEILRAKIECRISSQKHAGKRIPQGRNFAIRSLSLGLRPENVAVFVHRRPFPEAFTMNRSEVKPGMPEKQWPELPLEAWRDTYATLHMWTQIVGKVRLALAPHINHWWQVPLYVNSRGLTTSAIPYAGRTFEVQFDFIEHRLLITVCDGDITSLPLHPQTVAAFYAQFMTALRALGIEVRIWPMP